MTMTNFKMLQLHSIARSLTMFLLVLHYNITLHNGLGAVSSFSMPMFTEHAALKRTTPSKTDGVEIELPNFDELFSRIKQVSSLAKMVIDSSSTSDSTASSNVVGQGFSKADAECK